MARRREGRGKGRLKKGKGVEKGTTKPLKEKVNRGKRRSEGP